jgi:uncharacterized protein YicC (UPF0701 family)
MKDELNTIQAFLEEPMDETPQEIIARGALLQVYLARTTKMLADAKHELNAAKTSEIMNILKEVAKQSKASSTVMNELVKASCRDEQYIVDWLERMNKAITHQLEFCRSALSFAKEDMKFSYYNLLK